MGTPLLRGLDEPYRRAIRLTAFSRSARKNSPRCASGLRFHVRSCPIGERREAFGAEFIGEGYVGFCVGAKVAVLFEVVHHLAQLPRNDQGYLCLPSGKRF